MRLDEKLCADGFFSSRTKASEAIKFGEITVNGKLVLKPSFTVNEGAVIKAADKVRYVSNGGYKLEKAIRAFGLSFDGLTVIDVGASTGGFTDCLLKNGAKLVYAVDVGENLIDLSLRADNRVIIKENYNARFLNKDDFACEIDAAVVDCSFISLTYLLEAIGRAVKTDGTIVALIKPQFECGRAALSKNGVVTDKRKRFEACVKLCDFASSVGFVPTAFTASPQNFRKNHEYLLLLKRSGRAISKDAIKTIIDEVTV